MTILADRLHFTPPYMPIHEAAHVLRLIAQVPDFQQLLWILESQRAVFSDYKALLSLLKDHYGFTEEENPFQKARTISQAYIQEKNQEAPGQEEKQAIAFTQKIFKGRILYRRSFESQDSERDARADWEASFLWYQRKKRENKAALDKIAAEVREERLARINADTKASKVAQ